ncbi:hypothetical protein LWU33_08640 [Enterobacter hormaechei]|nr:hypothetical protein [Enterobacter hormaechei]MCE1550029.1 hypothetical protein [Enterobacter hormaechei]
MITFTKEQLIASAHARIEFAEMMLAGELEPLKERTWSIELELARIALASLEADSKLSNFIATQESLGVAFERVLAENIEELYVPSKSTPPALVSDSLLSELLAIAKKAADAADECAHAEFSDNSMEHSAAIADWERRVAMLQDADGKADEGIFVSKSSEMSVSNITIDDSRCSNSTVIPDGWVMVPVEPTEQMIMAAGPNCPDAFDYLRTAYKDIIAAAPQQEDL